jgi:hypothetical protein
MDYQVVFDIGTAGYRSWPFAATGLIFIVVGIVLTASRWLLPDSWRQHPVAVPAFGFAVLGFAVLWTTTSFLATYRDYTAARDAVLSHRARVAEGVVTRFTPMPATGHALESFCVADACFHYSDYIVTAGFNNTRSHGGPIRDGLPVRVTYVGNTIVKLEVRR